MEKEMKKIVVTGATSMIGSALIEECVKHDIEVYAVLRSTSGKQDRLPDSSLVHLIDSSLETLEELPELIPQGCDTFYHIAWGNTGENRNRSTELQSRNIGYTLAAVRAANALGCKRFIGAGSQAEYGPMDVEKISQSDESIYAVRCKQAGIRPSRGNALPGTGDGMYLAEDFQCLWDP